MKDLEAEGVFDLDSDIVDPGTEAADDANLFRHLHQQAQLVSQPVDPMAPSPIPMDLLDLYEDDDDLDASMVTEDTAPNLMTCTDCHCDLKMDEEPVDIMAFPMRWRWSCPSCNSETIVSD